MFLFLTLFYLSFIYLKDIFYEACKKLFVTFDFVCIVTRSFLFELVLTSTFTELYLCLRIMSLRILMYFIAQFCFIITTSRKKKKILLDHRLSPFLFHPFHEDKTDSVLKHLLQLPEKEFVRNKESHTEINKINFFFFLFSLSNNLKKLFIYCIFC